MLAAYMKQDMIPKDHLNKRGLLAFFIQNEENKLRFARPMEGSLTHVVHTSVFINAKFEDAWTIQGNAISTPHAFIALYQVGEMLQHIRPTAPGMEQAMRKHGETRIRASETTQIGSEIGDVFYRDDLGDAKRHAQRILQGAANLAALDGVNGLGPGATRHPESAYASAKPLRNLQQVLSEHPIETRMQLHEEPEEFDKDCPFDIKTRLDHQEESSQRPLKSRKINEEPGEEVVDAIEDFHSQISQKARETWNGVQEKQLFPPRWISKCLDTQIDSPTTTEVEMSPTQRFQPYVWMATTQNDRTFWLQVDASLTRGEVEAIWQGGIQIHVEDSGNWTTLPGECHMQLYAEIADCDAAYICTQSPSLLTYDKNVPLQDQWGEWCKNQEWFDAFGSLAGVTTSGVLAIGIEHFGAGESATKVLSQMQRTHQVCAIMPAINTFALSISGIAEDRQKTAAFWKSVLEEDVLEKIGRLAQIEHNEKQSIVMWSPHCSIHAAPIGALRDFLLVAGARAMLNAECEKGDVFLKIKWQGRPLWQAHIRGDTRTEVIREILEKAAAMGQGEPEIRLVCNGKTQWTDAAIENWASLVLQDGSKKATLHVVYAKHGGGNLDTSKQSKPTPTKNALATVLLQLGYDLHITSKAVEAMTKQVSISKLAASVQGNHLHRQQAVREICKEVGFELPGVSPLTLARLENGNHHAKNKKQKYEIDPTTLRLPEDFFTNEDGTRARQLPEFRPHGTGIFVTTPQIAMQLLQGNKCLSKDELAIVVIGHEELHTSRPSETIQLPALDGCGKETLLAATMIQAGEKKIRHIFHEYKPETQEKIIIIAWTTWRDSFGDEEWVMISKSPEAALRDMLKREGQENETRSIWGRSCRLGKHPSSPGEATSIQIHSSMPGAVAEKVLAISGWNKWFATPKDTSGLPAKEWRIIWTADTPEILLGKSAGLPSCSGLARNLKGFGIRIKTEHFAAAWDILHPNKQAPSTLAPHHTYKVGPVPYGTTSIAVEKWGQTYNWQIRALKTLGAKTWLIASEMPRPEGTMGYNGHPVLVQEIPGRAREQGPVIAGARPMSRTSMQYLQPQQGPRSAAKDP